MASVKERVFFCLVLALISSRSVQQHLLASRFVTKTCPKSVVRRIQRFFEKQPFDFSLLAKGLLEMLALGQKVDLVIDRTNWKFGVTHINFLVLSVTICHKHAVPILWVALPKAGTSSALEQCDLLGRFVDIFGADRIATLTADREFIGSKWLSFLAHAKIPFYVRLKQDRLVEWGGGEKRQVGSFFKHLRSRQKRLIHKEIAGICVVISGTRSCAGELVLVVTNQTHQSAAKILTIYRRRWAIETLFRNTKSSGFHFEDTHVKSLERLEKMMGLMAVATAICLRSGQEQEALKPTPYRKSVKAKLYSLFRRGFDFLNKLLFDPSVIKTILKAVLNPIPHQLKKSVG